MDDLDCISEQKLKDAISLLRDETYQWWLTVKEGTQPDQLTWEFVKTAFQGKYVGVSYVDARRREFLNLTQRDRSVAEYEAEFLRLSRYARSMVVTEYERCIRFEDSLRDNLRAKIAEEVKRAERQNRKRSRNKRDLKPSSSVQRPKKKAKVDRPIRVGAPIAATEQTLCTDCGRRHQGECWKRTRACLRGTAPPSRVVQQPPKGYGQARGGNGLGHGQRASGRDIGSTHSYIAYTVSENLGLLVQSTTSEVTVLSPLGQSVRVNKLFRDIPLEVQEAIFLADMIELRFKKFDLILGMDWLVKHQVSLDCATKRVVLRTEEDNEVVVIGQRGLY
ncbi:uncharacterized protein LOC108472152 [Gossypium arboreum]|uniref:uncharacterized protein LOC108472152 n=1 Tax=Gossypium arboreum TaxID=29729 RepID=UPI0008191E47|nr:uncharacterized protein LOC108472152 [Gossypium arboreum]